MPKKNPAFVSTICLGLLVASLTACQTGRLKEISRLEKGMTKNEVLDIAGGPQRSERKRDQDVWTYIVPEERRDVLKEVDFAGGRVSYVGDPVLVSGPSAAEQDRINEESNSKSEAQLRRERLLEDVSGSQSRRSGGGAVATAIPGASTATASTIDVSVEDSGEASTKPAPKPLFVPLEGAANSGQ